MQLRPIRVIIPAAFTLLALASPPCGLGQQPSTVPIPPAGLAGSGPVGLFARAVVNFSSGSVEVRTLLFLPGNRVVRAYPYGGGEAFDLSRCNPDMCGRYELTGDRMTLLWDDGRTDQWSYAPSDDAVDLDGDRYRPARPVSADELMGSWADTPGNVYTFARDGTFSFGAGGSALTGRYTLASRTLSLSFQDGSTRTRTLFAAGSGDPVGMISVDGDAFRRR